MKPARIFSKIDVYINVHYTGGRVKKHIHFRTTISDELLKPTQHILGV